MASCSTGANADDQKVDFEIDMIVQTKDKKPKIGYIKFIGENKYTKDFFGAGTIVGIFLSEKRGTMDGTYKNEKFFRCPQGHGIMVKESKIKMAENVDDKFKEAKVYKEWAEKLKKEAASEEAIAQAKLVAANIKKLFKSMDDDSGGDLSKEEFVKALGEKGIEACDAKQFFGKIDATNSNSISFAEFKKYIEEAASDPSMIPEKVRGLLSAS